jgi:enoyl-CoA hydratase/carnithine racemase
VRRWPDPGEVVPAEDLRKLVGSDRELVGVAAGVPVLSVDVRDTAAAQRLAELLAGAPCVLVGVSPDAAGRAPAGYDVLLTDVAGAGRPWVTGVDRLPELLRRVAANPVACVIIVQLLRMSHGLPVTDALAAESMAYAMLQSGDEFRRWLATADPPAARPDEREPVLIERSGRTVVVTLNRPTVRNAVNAAIRDGIVAACELVAADPTVEELRLRGAGPSFCSGGDLTEFGRFRTPVLGHVARTTRSAARSLLTSRVPVVVDVHGAAVGAGAELAACGSRVRAHPDAFFALPEQRMGLLPGAGGTVSITRRAGRHRCAYLALSGARIDAGTAHRWGLVDDISTLAAAARD